jgi:hypothetical protein
MSEEIIGHCWHCGAALTRADYGRETCCLGCGKATRCCRNCRFFQRGRPNDCIEPMAEAVADKARANFCDFFEPSMRPESGEGPGCDDAQWRAAEDLFK